MISLPSPKQIWEGLKGADTGKDIIKANTDDGSSKDGISKDEAKGAIDNISGMLSPIPFVDFFKGDGMADKAIDDIIDRKKKIDDAIKACE